MADRRKPGASATRPARGSTVAQLPVTRAMLTGVRDELKALHVQTNARLDQTNARLDQTNARFDQANARLDQTNARMEELGAAQHAELHRLGVLMEEQDVRNRVALEVVQSTRDRFDRLEARIDELYDLVLTLVRSPRG